MLAAGVVSLFASIGVVFFLIFVIHDWPAHWGSMIGTILLTSAVCVAAGSLLGNLLRHRQSVALLTRGSSVPLFFLSGVFNPITYSTAGVVVLARLFPVHYATALHSVVSAQFPDQYAHLCAKRAGAFRLSGRLCLSLSRGVAPSHGGALATTKEGTISMNAVQPMPYTAVTFDLTGQLSPFPGESLQIAGWVFAPPTLPSKPVVLVCFPGASYTKAYYHLDVPGYAPDAYSFAASMTRHGFLVVALDHLGVGDSSRPDGTRLSLEVMAHANALATQQVTERVRTGTLVPALPPQPESVVIGVGHSMGAFVLLQQQATAQSFAALALLGYSNWPVWPLLETSPADLLAQSARGYLPAQREALSPFFFAPDVEREAIEADARLASDCPLGIFQDLQQPRRDARHL